MSSEQAVVVRKEDEQKALAPVQECTPKVERLQVTAAQARIESVAHALEKAYANASSLVLTPDEAKALVIDFPDEAFRLGAGGDDRLIYIEHAYLREGLNTVHGVGAVLPIRRGEGAEVFTYIDRFSKTQEAVRVYVDLVLLVRGCLVGEAVGDAVYYRSNDKTNFSDALESAKSNAFRRCCKEFGVGLQAWKKGWGEGWKLRNPGNGVRGARPPVAEPVARPATPAPVPPPAPSAIKEVVTPGPVPPKPVPRVPAPKKQESVHPPEDGELARDEVQITMPMLTSNPTLGGKAR